MSYGYFIRCNGINGYREFFCEGNIFTAMEVAESTLNMLGGGYAKIYDKDDNIVGGVVI